MNIILSTKTHDHGEYISVTSEDYEISEDGRFHIIHSPEGNFWRYECYAFFSPYGWKKGLPMDVIKE